MGRIGRFQSRDDRALPARGPPRDDRRPVTATTPESGREPRPASGRSSVFVHQAGIALENAFLQRKLQSPVQGRESG